MSRFTQLFFIAAIVSGTAIADDNFYGRAGVHYKTIGEKTYGSDGSVYQPKDKNANGLVDKNAKRIGDTIYNADGSTVKIVGNKSYRSDGSVCDRVGGSTYCNKR